MKTHQLSNFTGGWFVGNFHPAILQTPHCEIACKSYPAGHSEPRHVHRVATEITLIVSGQVIINHVKYAAGDLIELAPNEPAEFTALTDAVTVVVKLPSVPNDKFPAPLPTHP